MAKRFVDIFLASIALIGLSPLLATVAAAIRLIDGKPVIFRQERVGLHGELFSIHKFRSMRPSNNGALVTTGGDTRITALGAHIRRTKIDELPQLFDVAIGRMSLVGPRPEVSRYVAEWPDSIREVCLSVRPGITDPASWALIDESQILSQQEDPESYYKTVLVPFKCSVYYRYAMRRDMGTDMRIIVGTLARLLHFHRTSRLLANSVFRRLEVKPWQYHSDSEA